MMRSGIRVVEGPTSVSISLFPIKGNPLGSSWSPIKRKVVHARCRLTKIKAEKDSVGRGHHVKYSSHQFICCGLPRITFGARFHHRGILHIEVWKTNMKISEARGGLNSLMVISLQGAPSYIWARFGPPLRLGVPFHDLWSELGGACAHPLHGLSHLKHNNWYHI